MDIRVMRYFLTVVEEGNISKAANKLFITQPTLSRQISDLEDQLQTKLFIRGSRKLTLTDTGHVFKNRATSIVEIYEKLEREIHDLEDNIVGQISIGCGENAAKKALPQLIINFVSQYPKVKFFLDTSGSDQVKDKLENGLLDFGVVMEYDNDPRYDHIKLPYVDRWVILMKKEDALAELEYISVKTLKEIPLFLPNRNKTMDILQKWGSLEKDELKIVGTFNLNTFVPTIVENGFAYALTVDGAMDFDKNKFVMKELYPHIESKHCLIWKKSSSDNPIIKKIINFIKTQIVFKL